MTASTSEKFILTPEFEKKWDRLRAEFELMENPETQRPWFCFVLPKTDEEATELLTRTEQLASELGFLQTVIIPVTAREMENVLYDRIIDEADSGKSPIIIDATKIVFSTNLMAWDTFGTSLNQGRTRIQDHLKGGLVVFGDPQKDPLVAQYFFSNFPDINRYISYVY